MSRWSEHGDAESRRELVEALLRALQRWGPVPEPAHRMLAELASLHTRALLDAREACAHALRAARASVACAVPPPHWGHVAEAMRRCAHTIPFEKVTI